MSKTCVACNSKVGFFPWISTFNYSVSVVRQPAGFTKRKWWFAPEIHISFQSQDSCNNLWNFPNFITSANTFYSVYKWKFSPFVNSPSCPRHVPGGATVNTNLLSLLFWNLLLQLTQDIVALKANSWTARASELWNSLFEFWTWVPMAA